MGSLRAGDAELLYESATTLVLRTGGRVRKEALGPGARRRALHECAVLERLAGVEGIPRLLSAPSSRPVLDIADGGMSLADAIRRKALSVRDVVHIGAQLAWTLHAIHARGVIHADISPANVAVTPDSSGSGAWRSVLIDFDCAAVASAGEDSPQHGGTLAYAAPEQTGRTGRQVDVRTDLYALGATLYEAATGQPPFDTADPLELMHSHMARAPVPADARSDVPRAFSDILLRLLAKDPGSRYQSAEGLAHDLQRTLESIATNEQFPLGTRDFPARLAAPSQLAGRAREQALLLAALEDARAGTVRALLIEGPAGIGKSALLEGLRSAVQSAGGIFVYGKFDQYQNQWAADTGLTQALSALARRLLALPAERLELQKIRLRECLDRNAPSLAFIPEFSTLLHVHRDLQAQDTTEQSLSQATVDVLRAVASVEHPLVLALDDLQWARAEALRVFDRVIGDEGPRGLLLVGTFRELAPDTQSQGFASFAARWTRSNAVRRVLPGELDRDGVSQLLSQMLRLPAAQTDSLAAILLELTSGNPLELVELVNALRAGGLVRLTDGGWEWDAAAVRRFAGHESLSNRIAARVAQLAPGTRAALQCMSCLGTPVENRVLQAAACIGAEHLPTTLEPASREAIVVLDEAGATLRFRHDLIQQAVFTSLGEAERGELQLAMARRLLQAGLSTEAAQQYLDAASLVNEPGERTAAAKVLHAYARSLLARGENAVGERSIAIAAQLAAGVDSRLDADISTDHHAVLVRLGRAAEADAVFRRLQETVVEPLRMVQPVCTQSTSLMRRARVEEGVELAEKQLSALGFAYRMQLESAELARLAEPLVRWAASPDLPRECNADPIAGAAMSLLGRISLTSMWSDDFRRTLSAALQAMQLWRAQGVTPMLVECVAAASPLQANFLQDYRGAFALAARALRDAEAAGFTQSHVDSSRAAFYGSMAYWIEPFEECVEQLLAIRDRLRPIGAFNGSYGSRRAAMLMMECESLDAAEAEVDVALDISRRFGHPMGWARIVRQWIRMLRGQTNGPGDLGEGETSESDLAKELPAHSAGNLAYLRLVSALMLGDHDSLLSQEALPLPLSAWKEGDAVGRHLRLVFHPNDYLAFSIRCVEQLRRQPGVDEPARRATLDQCVAWFAARAEDQPANMRHLHHLIEAERAAVHGDHWKAAKTFDTALQEVRHRRRPWHRALIAERAALFHLAHGLAQTGMALMADARAHYEQWGARAKVRVLEDRYPWLTGTGAGRPPIETAASFPSGTPSLDALDLAGILRAAQALGSARTMRELAARVTQVVAALTGSTRVSMIVHADGKWSLVSPAADETMRLVPVGDAAAAGLLPISVHAYAVATGQAVHVDDVTRDDRFARDPYFAGREPGSLVVLPLSTHGAPSAMLLLENSAARAAFGPSRLDAVTVIAGQLAVSLENALLNDQLEAKVRERTAQLEQLQNELVATARRAGMAQVANNVLHNVGNVLNSVTVAGSMLRRRLADSHAGKLSLVSDMLEAHRDDLGAFLAGDERGKLLPAYLRELAEALGQEKGDALADVERLLDSIDHISAIVSSQQSFAGSSSLEEVVSVDELVDEAVRLDGAGAHGREAAVERRYGPIPPLPIDRLRVTQILVNLVGNANEAMLALPADARKLTLETQLRTSETGERLVIRVRDSGHGISADHLPKLFTHGFTTKSGGHGFGLHSAAVAAVEMGGRVMVHSDGPGKGATFTLEIPVRTGPDAGASQAS